MAELIIITINIGTNIPYDQYRNTKQVLTAIRNSQEDRINYGLTSQGFIFFAILMLSDRKTCSLWSIVK